MFLWCSFALSNCICVHKLEITESRHCWFEEMYMIQFQHLERVNGHTLVSDYHLLWEFLRCIDSIKENGYMFLDFHSVLLIIRIISITFILKAFILLWRPFSWKHCLFTLISSITWTKHVHDIVWLRVGSFAWQALVDSQPYLINMMTKSGAELTFWWIRHESRILFARSGWNPHSTGSSSGGPISKISFHCEIWRWARKSFSWRAYVDVSIVQSFGAEDGFFFLSWFPTVSFDIPSLIDRAMLYGRRP